MTDKELRRLKRAELLELLYYLQKENEELKEEVAQLKTQAAQPNTQLAPASVDLPADFMEQMRQAVQDAVSAKPKRKKRR